MKCPICQKEMAEYYITDEWMYSIFKEDEKLPYIIGYAEVHYYRCNVHWWYGGYYLKKFREYSKDGMLRR